MTGGRVHLIVPSDLSVVVSMDINPSWGHDGAISIDDLLATRNGAHLNNFAIANTNISIGGLGTAAVIDRAALDDDIVRSTHRLASDCMCAESSAVT